MKKKRIAIVVLSVLLTICMSFPANANILSSNKVTSTIDAQLQTILQNTVSTKKIPVDIWLYETSTKQEREQEIYTKIGINKAQLISTTRNNVSIEQIDKYITTARSLYAAEREEQYTALRQEYANIDGLQVTRGTNTRLFYSRYAPMVRAELTRTEINKLARDSRVQAIAYSPDVTLVDESNISTPTIGADYTRDTLNYKGNGIKIGMIESRLPNKFAGYFTPARIIYEDMPYEERAYSDHANTVAAIMVGKATSIDGVTYTGIVPNATLYATYSYPSSEGDWRARIEWLLSQGVHVINMSAEIDGAAAGVYSWNERWVDHITNNHYVHFVTSAGNSNTRVTSPGMAYNILTVGAMNDNDTEQHSDDTRYNTSSFGSCYIESDGWTNKPDLVAPGVNIHTAAYIDSEDYPKSGTSYAAPHVTAIVAQLCQSIGSLCVMQPCVKAILTASISHSIHAYDCSATNAYNYDQYGAGVVNAKAAFETTDAYHMMGGRFPANGAPDAEKVYTFSADSGQRVRVSVSWLRYSYFPETIPHEICNPSVYSLANLDLYIIDPDGEPVANSSGLTNNTEIVDFITPKPGTYQMLVINRTPSIEDIELGIAWWIE